MASVKPYSYEAQFKLQAMEYASENGNWAAARHFSVNECMARKWRKQISEQEDEAFIGIKQGEQSWKTNWNNEL